MRVAPSHLIAPLAVGVAALTGTFGCEFIASVDRSKIQDVPTGGAGVTSSSSSSSAGATGGGADGGGGSSNGGGGMGGMGGMGGGMAGGGMGGMGGMPECMVAMDCPGMDTDCAKRTCVAMECGTMNEPTTTTCDEMGGAVCDGMGACVECNADADCVMPEVCDEPNKLCVPTDCMNGAIGQLETDIDCGGGTCPACIDGKMCGMSDANCTSGVCTGMVCQAPTCMDGVDNGTETDIDCGGTCPGCADGEGCAVNADCASNSCTGTVCLCGDGVQNDGESDVDCGGANCTTKCALDDSCVVNADCANNNCVGNICEHCGDGILNGGEPSIDCGGTCATKCADDANCNVGADCTSLLCEAGTCGLNGCTLAGATDLTGMSPVTITFSGTTFLYTPKCIRVTAGTDVTFTADAPATFGGHPLVPQKEVGGLLVTDPGSPFDHQMPAMDTTFTFTAVALGNHAFACLAHGSGGMNGAVFVVP